MLQKAKTKPFPAIVAIPTSRGSTGYGLESVRKDVEKAIDTLKANGVEAYKLGELVESDEGVILC